MEKTLRLRDNMEIEVSIRVRQTVNYSPVTLAEHSSRMTRTMTLEEVKDEIKAMSAESYDPADVSVDRDAECQPRVDRLEAALKEGEGITEKPQAQ